MGSCILEALLSRLVFLPSARRTSGRGAAPLSPASSRSAAPGKSRAAAGAERRRPTTPLGLPRWPPAWPGGRWSAPPGRGRMRPPAPRGGRPAPSRTAAGSAPRSSPAARCHPVLRLPGSSPACFRTLQLRQLLFPSLRPPWRRVVCKQRQQNEKSDKNNDDDDGGGGDNKRRGNEITGRRDGKNQGEKKINKN